MPVAIGTTQGGGIGRPMMRRGSSMLSTGPQKRESEPLAVAVMGATGSGKSTFINLVSGSDLPISHGLRSCTKDVLKSNTFEVAGRQMVLLDTPGFDDSDMSDTEVLRKIVLYLKATYSEGATLSGLIYVHRISDPRVGGTSRQNIRMFKKLCGDGTLKNVTIITTRWSEPGSERAAEEMCREDQLKKDSQVGFAALLSNGAIIRRHDKTRATALSIVERFVTTKPKPLRIQRELVEDKIPFEKTTAAAELSSKLDHQTKRYAEEIARLKSELKEAQDAKDTALREELERDRRKHVELIRKTDRERNNLAEDYRKAEEKLQKVLQVVEDQKKQREEWDRELKKLRRQLERSQRKSEAEQERLRNLIRRLQSKEPKQREGGVWGWFTKVVKGVTGATSEYEDLTS